MLESYPYGIVDAVASMKAARHDQILSELTRRGSLSVEAMAAMFQVSEATIRRDLHELDRKGLLRRTHGGATLVERDELPYQSKVTAFLAEKRRIGALAASLLQPGQLIFCSGGTTVTQAVKALRGMPLTVVTNAINIALELASAEKTEVVLTGGSLRSCSYETVGHVAERTIRQFVADVALLGVDGLTVQDGLMTFSPTEAFVNRIFIEQAREVWVVADHSKLGKVTPAVIAPLARAHLLITDAGAPEGFLKEVTSRGIRVMAA